MGEDDTSVVANAEAEARHVPAAGGPAAGMDRRGWWPVSLTWASLKWGMVKVTRRLLHLQL
ncbi:hypothetical protein [Synechococcus sp. 1G10]|uniref:hypothetical protein n=1 Tax=Synechococcus sp. 1G10 TaxID=2025605 RepID=UPI000B98D67B|nr:hypothetical protein [Synechococcus sp. 1G10]